MKNECLFCNKNDEKILFENKYAKAFYDEFPVNKGHVLVVPKACKLDYFAIDEIELLSIHRLVKKIEEYLLKTYGCDGINIGWNAGEAAGQTVFHAHCHVIPRYVGDVEKPKGGIRNFKKPLVDY